MGKFPSKKIRGFPTLCPLIYYSVKLVYRGRACYNAGMKKLLPGRLISYFVIER